MNPLRILAILLLPATLSACSVLIPIPPSREHPGGFLLVQFFEPPPAPK